MAEETSPSRLPPGRPKAPVGALVAAVLLALGLPSCSTSPAHHAASTTTRAVAPTSAPPPTSGPPTEPSDALAAEAYVWGVPLVVSTRTAQSVARLIGVDRLFNQQQLTTPGVRLVVAPNVDTLYSIAVLDLRRGAVTLTVPAIRDRYYTYQFLDAYTNSFAYVGTRATGGEAGTWFVAPPHWNGKLPVGDHLVRAPTPIVFLLGRFLVDGPGDLSALRAAMAQVRLSAPAAALAEPPGSLGTARGAPGAVALAGASFFDELGDDLTIDPPPNAAEQAMLDRFAALGIGPGRHPDATGSAALRARLGRGVASGNAAIQRAVAASARIVNGWSTSDPHTGAYGDDYALRAAVALTGWGANIPAEAVYLTSRRDGQGRPYSGKRRYLMRFPAGTLPPAHAFWSLTAYGPDGFLVANAAGRYDVGDRAPGLHTNRDGSLDLLLQHGAPATNRSNWLPVPSGRFRLVLRVYLPGPSVISGQYEPPPVLPAP